MRRRQFKIHSTEEDRVNLTPVEYNKEDKHQKNNRNSYVEIISNTKPKRIPRIIVKKKNKKKNKNHLKISHNLSLPI